jgi:hypothetical protein
MPPRMAFITAGKENSADIQLSITFEYLDIGAAPIFGLSTRFSTTASGWNPAKSATSTMLRVTCGAAR